MELGVSVTQIEDEDDHLRVTMTHKDGTPRGQGLILQPSGKLQAHQGAGAAQLQQAADLVGVG